MRGLAVKHYDDLVAEALTRVKEIMLWDLNKRLAAGDKPLLLDVREPAEFAALRIPGSINVPRGVLEQSCEWDYDETVPELAADAMLKMGFANVVSLRTGIRGWNDAETAGEWGGQCDRCGCRRRAARAAREARAAQAEVSLTCRSG